MEPPPMKLQYPAYLTRVSLALPAEATEPTDYQKLTYIRLVSWIRSLELNISL